MESVKWSSRYLMLANEISTWSYDPVTKVGCVIVKNKHIISTGYNGFPAGIDDILLWDKDKTFKRNNVVHAEMNAIIRSKQDLTGADLYCTVYPCPTCATGIIQAGIKNIYISSPENASAMKFKDRFKANKTKVTLELAGVNIEELDASSWNFNYLLIAGNDSNKTSEPDIIGCYNKYEAYKTFNEHVEESPYTWFQVYSLENDKIVLSFKPTE